MAVDSDSTSYLTRAERIQSYLQSPSSVDETLFTYIDWMAMRIALTHSPTLSEETRATIQKKSAPFLNSSLRSLREQSAVRPTISSTNALQSHNDFILDYIKICDLSFLLSEIMPEQEEDSGIEDQKLKEWFDALQSSLPKLDQKFILYLALTKIRTLHPKWLNLPSVDALEKQTLSQEPISDTESQHLPPSIQKIVQRVDNQLNGHKPIAGLAAIVAILSETPVVTTESKKKELLKHATHYTQYLCKSIKELNSIQIKSPTQQQLHRLKSIQKVMLTEQQVLENLGALYHLTQNWQKKSKSLTNCMMFSPDDPDYQAFHQSYQELLTLVQIRDQQTRNKPDELSIVYLYPFDQLQRNHILDREVVDYLTFANPSFDSAAREKVFWTIQGLFVSTPRKIPLSKRLQERDPDKERYEEVMDHLSMHYLNKGELRSFYSDEDQTYIQNKLFPYIYQKAKEKGWKTNYPLLHGLVRERIDVAVPEEWKTIDMKKKCEELAQKLLDDLQKQPLLSKANEDNLVEMAKKIDPQSDPSILVNEDLTTSVFLVVKETIRRLRLPIDSKTIPSFKVIIPQEVKISKSDDFTREVQNLILRTLQKDSKDYSRQEAFIATASLQEPVAIEEANNYIVTDLAKQVKRVENDPNYPEENLAYILATTRVAIQTILQDQKLFSFLKSNHSLLSTRPSQQIPLPMHRLLFSVANLGPWCARERAAWKDLMSVNEPSRHTSIPQQER